MYNDILFGLLYDDLLAEVNCLNHIFDKLQMEEQ